MKQTDQLIYQDEFLAEKGPPVPRRAEALKQALDIRKFEIDLYWRRANYFWTFIGAAFVGYSVAQDLDELTTEWSRRRDNDAPRFGISGRQGSF